jgi:hypothetical protein
MSFYHGKRKYVLNVDFSLFRDKTNIYLEKEKLDSHLIDLSNTKKNSYIQNKKLKI